MRTWPGKGASSKTIMRTMIMTMMMSIMIGSSIGMSKYEGLIIDDIGYVQHSPDEMEVLFTLLRDRDERGGVLLTSNLAFSQLERIFQDPMTTAAAIDRLVHHCIILELNVPSYVLQESRKRNEEEAVWLENRSWRNGNSNCR